MYRDEEAMKKWNEYIAQIGNPIERFYKYLEKKNWINEAEYKATTEAAQKEVRKCLKTALEYKKPSIESMFDDVYEEMPVHLQQQKAHLMKHIAKYKDEYDVGRYSK